MKYVSKMKWAALAVLVGALGVSAVMAKDNKSGKKERPGFMQTFDLNKDGAVTQEEMAKARDARMKEKGKKAPSKESAERSDAKIRDAFARLDANKDGKITKDETPEERVVTREEYLKKATERFNAMDLNKDGKITGAERREIKEKFRAKVEQKQKGASKSER